MELQQLKYFKTVAQTGKISGAAEALFISAPALSTSIARLEKELGVQLFDRTNNRISLNERGQILLKYTNQIFSSLEQAKSELRQSTLQQGPHISLVSVNSAMWVDLIAAFTSEYPQFTLSCSSITIPALAESGFPAQHNFLLAAESDLPTAYQDKLDSIFLFQAAPMVMLHKDHPLAGEAALDIRAVYNEKIFMPASNHSLYARLQQLFTLHNLPFPTDNHYSYLARQKMVSENIGISFCYNRSGNIAFPNIRCVSLVDSLPPWNTRLYWRKEHPLDEHQRAFCAFTKQFFEALH